MICEKCQHQNPPNSLYCSKCAAALSENKDKHLPKTQTLNMPLNELAIGTTFADRYLIIENLGQGGMGKVYKAIDKKINENIAIKLLRPEIATDAGTIERFQNELRMARKISHKNVCRMYHLSEEKSTHYLTMEYVSGEDLKSLIRRIGKLTVGKTVSVAKQVCDGLSEAHKLGVVHRDLKPQNLMIDNDGNVRIMDFGIAMSLEAKKTSPFEGLMGTPAYMSPEQVEGSDIDKRTDIYSLGIILYEMVTGQMPFQGDSALGIAIKQKTGKPIEPKKLNPELPESFNRLILKCLEKNKKLRFQTADEIQTELTRIDKAIPDTTILLPEKKSFVSVFMHKLKDKKIFTTIAAFIVGGWMAVEFAHHLLVNHYHLPKYTVDVTLYISISAMLITLAIQWFKPGDDDQVIEKEAKTKRFRWGVVGTTVAFVLIAGFYLTKSTFLHTPDIYGNYILLDISSDNPQDFNKALLEFSLKRALMSSSELDIYTQQDYVVYQKKTELLDSPIKRPILAIFGDIFPKTNGFEISIMLQNQKETNSFKIDCKGYSDLILNKMGELHSQILENAGGLIGHIEGGRSFDQVTTNKFEALEHFVEGEVAWKKLDSDTAYYEYRTATEIDPDFGLAHLKLADVLYPFRGEKEKAMEHLSKAWLNEDRLIKYDVIEANAMMARIKSMPNEERQYLRQLIEAFPLNKEYHYNFAESHFRCGNTQAAIKYYKNALELDADYSLAHNHIAFCYSWEGNHSQAEHHFSTYVKLDNTANSYDSLASGYMFAGKYNQAIDALNEALALDPGKDYLYRNLALIYMQKGLLKKAEEQLDREVSITERANAKEDSQFYRAYIEFLRGDYDKATQVLRLVIQHYSNPLYTDDPSDSPNLPFWLSGLIAYKTQDSDQLDEMIQILDEKIELKGVNATNYFPIYKFKIHLNILKGHLEKDVPLIQRNIQEGQLIKDKLGYWASVFNLSFAFNEYAAVLISMNDAKMALDLLKLAIEYNPRFAPAYINSTKAYLLNGNRLEAHKQYIKADEYLSEADRDFILVKELKSLQSDIEIE